MKTVLREAGLPCARHRLITSADDALDFVREVGYPIVVKPPDGAGAKATFSVADDDALSGALLQVPPHPDRPLLAEEFVQGLRALVRRRLDRRRAGVALPDPLPADPPRRGAQPLDPVVRVAAARSRRSRTSMTSVKLHPVRSTPWA